MNNPLKQLDEAAHKMYNALGVITLDPLLHTFLAGADPKALEQCRDAMNAYLDCESGIFDGRGL